jgi:hypothetical protein
MKELGKMIVISTIAVYLGSAIANSIIHVTNAVQGQRMSKQNEYSEEMKAQWRNYSEANLERIVHPKILVPLSSIIDPARYSLNR